MKTTRHTATNWSSYGEVVIHADTQDLAAAHAVAKLVPGLVVRETRRTASGCSSYGYATVGYKTEKGLSL